MFSCSCFCVCCCVCSPFLIVLMLFLAFVYFFTFGGCFSRVSVCVFILFVEFFFVAVGVCLSFVSSWRVCSLCVSLVRFGLCFVLDVLVACFCGCVG